MNRAPRRLHVATQYLTKANDSQKLAIICSVTQQMKTDNPMPVFVNACKGARRQNWDGGTVYGNKMPGPQDAQNAGATTINHRTTM